jgi:AbrB family looped-hinge helix DNA binding protein
MGPVTSRLEPSGRVLIPAAIRQKLGFKPGEELIIVEEGGGVQIYTRAAALKKVQDYFAQFKDGRCWSEELIQERRREAARENEE